MAAIPPASYAATSSGQASTPPTAPTPPALVPLSLPYWKCSTADGARLALELHPTLTSLGLTNNRLSDTGPLATGLAAHKMIRRLDLTINDIHDVGPLAVALAGHRTLETLILRNNRVADLTPLATALTVNTSLTSLDISDNPVVNLTPVATALTTNSTLRSLILPFVSRDEQMPFFVPIAEALARNGTLTTLQCLPFLGDGVARIGLGRLTRAGNSLLEIHQYLERNIHNWEARASLKTLCIRALLRDAFNDMPKEDRYIVYHHVWHEWGGPNEENDEFGEHYTHRVWYAFENAVRYARIELGSKTIARYGLDKFHQLEQATLYIKTFFNPPPSPSQTHP